MNPVKDFGRRHVTLRGSIGQGCKRTAPGEHPIRFSTANVGAGFLLSVVTEQCFAKDLVRVTMRRLPPLSSPRLPSRETAPPMPVHADRAVVRARAIDLAGHYHSGVADLSEEHDRYLAEAFG